MFIIMARKRLQKRCFLCARWRGFWKQIFPSYPFNFFHPRKDYYIHPHRFQFTSSSAQCKQNQKIFFHAILIFFCGIVVGKKGESTGSWKGIIVSLLKFYDGKGVFVRNLLMLMRLLWEGKMESLRWHKRRKLNIISQ